MRCKLSQRKKWHFTSICCSTETSTRIVLLYYVFILVCLLYATRLSLQTTHGCVPRTRPRLKGVTCTRLGRDARSLILIQYLHGVYLGDGVCGEGEGEGEGYVSTETRNLERLRAKRLITETVRTSGGEDKRVGGRGLANKYGCD